MVNVVDMIRFLCSMIKEFVCFKSRSEFLIIVSESLLLFLFFLF